MFRITNSSDKPDIISAQTLRRTIGLLAFLLPAILIIGAAVMQDCQLVQNTISGYYHTIMRDFFVAALAAIAITLFAYRGYGKVDNLVGNAAAAATLGVAFFPTSVYAPFTGCLPVSIDTGIYSTIHYLSASLLFALLAFFCLCLFTKGAGQPTPKKIIRNRVYRLCGIVIILCIVLMAFYQMVFKPRLPGLADLRPVFFLETMALIAFSISWLTKGEAFLADN